MSGEWTPEAIETLRREYPQRGKRWCMQELGMTEPAIRAKAARLGLRQDRASPFFADWQSRAAASKVGKKRPEQAEVCRRVGLLPRSAQWRANSAEATRRLWKERGHPRGAAGMKHTEEAKAKMSQRSKETWRNKSPDDIARMVRKSAETREANGTKPRQRPEASWKAAWREIGGVRKFFRSRWEANYARYLEWLRQRGELLSWEHEPKTFWFDGIKRGCVSYLPDFRVTGIAGAEEYHEVKGWMDARSKTKIKRMAKYHPKVKLVVIASKQYKAIERAVSKLIDGWEL